MNRQQPTTQALVPGEQPLAPANRNPATLSVPSVLSVPFPPPGTFNSQPSTTSTRLGRENGSPPWEGCEKGRMKDEL